MLQWLQISTSIYLGKNAKLRGYFYMFEIVQANTNMRELQEFLQFPNCNHNSQIPNIFYSPKQLQMTKHNQL